MRSGEWSLGPSPPNRRYFSGCCTGCPGCGPLRRWKRLPPSRGTEPQAAAASDCPGAAASGRKEGLGSCGSGTGSRKADTPSADGRGAPGGSPGTVPAAPAEAAAEAPGTLIPVCPAVHNTPAGTIPAGVFFISCAKIYNPLLVPLPQNPYDNRGTFIKRKRLPWQSIIPMPPDACPCPGGKS